jgi:uncharacterized membrane protein YagU involved in acid resistance
MADFKQISARTANALLTGTVAGMIASIPMGMVMFILHRMLPPREQYALPPEEITLRVAADAGAEDMLKAKPTRRAVTWLAHIGYGGAIGSFYPIFRRLLKISPLLLGLLYGAGVWVESYFGWLPLFNILRPPTQTPARRNALMLFSHFVWGSLTAIIVEKLEKR